jgi:hypothetical protein
MDLRHQPGFAAIGVAAPLERRFERVECECQSSGSSVNRVVSAVAGIGSPDPSVQAHSCEQLWHK